MDLKEDVCILKKAGLCDEEIQAILADTDNGARIRRLRKLRCQLLCEIHVRQQTLDRLDYIIHQMHTIDKEEQES